MLQTLINKWNIIEKKYINYLVKTIDKVNDRSSDGSKKTKKERKRERRRQKVVEEQPPSSQSRGAVKKYFLRSPDSSISPA